ncbi:MAG: YcbK family protein [Nitrospirae bacterium]|nr:YcbK family protein [Nitrospirota bacterium]
MKPEKRDKSIDEGLSRRKFLAFGAVSALSAILPSNLFAALKNSNSSERALNFYNIHTDERLKTVYWHNDRYLPEALAEINHLLRDYRTDEVMEINTKLLDLLYAINRNMQTSQPFHVMSGYRSPATNAMLVKEGRGVGQKSLHMYGMATDISVPYRSLSSLRNVAKYLKAGGVGYYPESDFVHVDIGRVRYW